ncbi:uncharacterized protein LOC125027415 isoform X2 [Penaeus chinensis]|nr:uncharacterized protein LOC125027415 isoform X2 [Penaeus chinensis]
MWCGRAGVVGVVGAALLLLGLTQIVSGIYFMLTMPIFQLGSNIWTGTWSSMCGTVVATIGWTGQTMRRGQMVLVATLSVLVTNVANLVIIQVGENGVFLSESDVRDIVGNNQETTMLIAFWLTTVVTAMGIVVSFFGAQYLFCVVVRGPRVKGRMPVTRSLSEEDLHHRQVHTPPRLRSPSSAGAGEVAAPRAQRRSSSVGGGVQVHGMSGVGDHGEADGDGGGSTSGRTRLLSGGSGGGSSRGSQTGIDNPSSQPETPESCVPYFLRNHRSAWQFILPEVVHEMKQSQQFAARDPGSDVHSRTSTLSKASKSSFHPARPAPCNDAARPDLVGFEAQLQPLAHSRRNSRAPSSSRSTSIYSIPESCHMQMTPRPKVVRPSAPPPDPPTPKTSSGSRNMRATSAGGWESCAVVQYSPQAGGGFVVDLD